MQEKGMGVSDHRVYGYYGLTDLVKILDKTPGVGSLFDCQCRSIMRRTDRPQKAGFEQLRNYWFKSLSGLCGQGILSLGYYLRGIFLRKTCMGEWCQATDGASVSQT